jgi:hypothetical protein
MVVSKHLLMNQNRRQPPAHCGRRIIACLLVFAAWLAGERCLVHAGEAIIIPGEKSKATPLPENRPLPPQEVFRLRDATPGASPLDVLAVPPDQKKKRLDPKEEKRRRLEALEKKNWMIVDPGELQAEEKDKNFLNIRDYSLDGLEKEEQSGNLMFRSMKDDNRRVPGQFRSPSDPTSVSQARQREKTPAAPAPAEDQNDSAAAPRKDPQLGPHISSELNFKSMFESRQSSDSLAPKFNKSELILQTLMNSGAPSEATREEQARREEFRNFLNTPKTLSPLAGPSDPINSRSDLTRQPLNPTLGQPFGTENPNRAGTTPFGTPNATRPSVIPGLAGFDSPRDSAISTPQPWGIQDNSRSTWQRPATFEAPVPKRKF